MIDSTESHLNVVLTSLILGLNDNANKFKITIKKLNFNYL